MKAMLLLATALVVFQAGAQRKPEFWTVHQESQGLTGSLEHDMMIPGGLLDPNIQDSLAASASPGRKSALTAAAYSILIPGAGQVYTENYIPSALFVVAEVALWVTYSRYEKKGDNQTSAFENYADGKWSVVRYVQWIGKYMHVDTSGIIVSANPSLPPWQQVDWAKMNALEGELGQMSDNGFTHELPTRPTESYYELIGKYPQYGGGWIDAGYYTPPDILSSNVSPDFLFYSQMRGDANSFYNVATTAAYVIVANHILSALEAAWSAARFNSTLKAGARLDPVRRPDGLVEMVPTATISIAF